MRAARQRIDGERTYILHAYPYSETSLIVDVFSRGYGRLALLARGARRPRSVLRGILLAFQPLEAGWFGGGEVKTLAKAEWRGGMPLLQGKSLLVGYYLNELLLKLLPREDAHDRLFDAYERALLQLSERAGNTAALRRFEIALLRELGYGLQLERDAESGDPIDEKRDYVYFVERGPVAAGNAQDDMPRVAGSTLLDMGRDRFDDARTLLECKQLMRRLLAHYLGGQILQSRKVFMELTEP
jgi:DNA repair protein RecO (recombination protein O)